MKTKLELSKRWEVILENAIRNISNRYELYKDPVRNSKGSFNAGLHSAHREVGVLGYLLKNDIAGFKNNLSTGVGFKMELFERYDSGAPMPMDASPVSMFSFKELFDALASGDMVLAKRLANLMGGRPEVENKYDDEFMLSMGYSLKYATENNLEELKPWVKRLKDYCYDPKHLMTEFIGYPLVFEALLERNLDMANNAFKVLLEGHKKKCSKYKEPEYGPYFYDSPDADLFVWGIGLANLCRYYGLDLSIDDPLIPNELLLTN